MGIPYYFYTLINSYTDIVSESIQIQPDIYCMDFNGVIHPVCASQADKNEDKLIESLYTKVCDDIEALKPKKTIICVDGVVPVAKMFQQRKRRYLTVFKNKIDKVESAWDTNAITPGTEFMRLLNRHFKNKARYCNNAIVYSGSDENGEGEHKIFSFLEKEKDDLNVIINGLDADLIILSIMSHRKNIYLMRENDGSKTFVNINNLREAILSEVCKRWGIDRVDAYSNNARDIMESYSVMCSLLGNDFIPHLLTLDMKSGGLDKLIEHTKNTYKLHGLLVKDASINYTALSDILHSIAATEDRDIYTTTERDLKKTPFRYSTESEYYALKNKEKTASEIYSNTERWRNTYYKNIFDCNISIDSTTVGDACKNYISGIYWTYAYYKRKGYDNTWHYPYGYPPSVRDITNYTLGNPEPVLVSHTAEITPDMQLLIVLPRESKHLLKKEHQRFMEDVSAGLYHMFPSKYRIITYLKMHLWECSPVLPTINMALVRKYIN